MVGEAAAPVVARKEDTDHLDEEIHALRHTSAFTDSPVTNHDSVSAFIKGAYHERQEYQYLCGQPAARNDRR